MSKTGTDVKFLDSQLLSFDDIVAEEKNFTPIEVPERPKEDGSPGIVFMRPLTARTVIEFSEKGEDDKRAGVIELISQAICDRNGNLIFKTKDQIEKLKDTDVRVFTRLSQAVTGMIADLGKDLVEEGVGKGPTKDTDGSPTDLQKN